MGVEERKCQSQKMTFPLSDFHFVSDTVSGPLQIIQRPWDLTFYTNIVSHGCHIFHERYDQQLWSVNFRVINVCVCVVTKLVYFAISTWLTYLLTLSIVSVFNTVFQTLSSFFDKNLYCPRFVWIWFCFQPYIRRRQLWAEKWRFYLLLVSPCPLLPQCHLYQPHLRIVRPVSYLERPCLTIALATPLHTFETIFFSPFSDEENMSL